MNVKKTLLLSGGNGKTDIYESLETTNNFLRIWNREPTNTPITVFGLGASSNIFSIHPTKVQATQPINCNVYNGDGNSDVEFQRVSSTYLTFKASLIEATKQLTITTGGTQAKLEHSSSGNYTVFYAGNHIDTYATGSTPQRLNINYYSKGDVMIGDGATPSEVSINKFPIAGKALSVAGVINTDTGIETDVIDTTGDNNLVVKQNSEAILTYDVGDVNYPNGLFKFDKYVSINTGKYIQCNTIKAHIFDTHNSLEPNDVSFRYDGTTYMFYDQSLTNFQVRTDIASIHDITCVALTETSDKRFKERPLMILL